jgi:hypothetical protein
MKFLLSYIIVFNFHATLLKNSTIIGLIPITGFIAAETVAFSLSVKMGLLP